MQKQSNQFICLRGIFAIFASVYFGFYTDFNLAFFAEVLSLYVIFIKGKDFLFCLKNHDNLWFLAQALFPIVLSTGLFYLAMTKDLMSIPYYIGMWAILLGISDIVIGWQLYDLERSQAVQGLIKGVTLLLFAIFILFPEHMTNHVLGHLTAFYFVADGIEILLENYSRTKQNRQHSPA